MADTCPYCKIPIERPQKRVICQNCKNYAEAVAVQAQEEEEQQLFTIYKFIPLKWRGTSGWRTDPFYMKA